MAKSRAAATPEYLARQASGRRSAASTTGFRRGKSRLLFRLSLVVHLNTQFE